jgi:hypothetical protein
MVTFRSFRLVMTLVMAALLALPAVMAGADSDRVVHNTVQVHDVATIDWACAYPVTVTWDGTIKMSDYFAKDGTTWVKSIWNFIGYTVTFEANGKSISSPVSNTYFITPSDEPGWWVIAYNGIGGRILVPGEGLIKPGEGIGEVGRLVQLVYGDYEQWETIFASAGYAADADPWPVLCELLAE